MIEGARLTVCGRCVKHGAIVWEEKKPKRGMSRMKAPARRSPSKTIRKKSSQTILEGTLELAEGFDVKIRQARESLKLSHEDLGRKISEKVSVLKKIEAGKMTPDNKLAAKLEHALKAKLLVEMSEEKVPNAKALKSVSRELTLGDIISLDKRKSEEKTQRKR
jgi:putative transcription factor